MITDHNTRRATLLYSDKVPYSTNYDEPAHYARGLYDLGERLYAFLSPNGSWQETNTGLIAGERESLLVDTLVDVSHTRIMLDLMRPITDRCPIRYVVNTHADGDHWWGNQLLEHSNIISSEACYDEMKELTPRAFMSLSKLGVLLRIVGLCPGLSRCRRIGAWWQRMLAPYSAAASKVTLPSRRFTGELTVDVGGREVKLIEVGPMHTRGDIMVYVPDARTLYAGDALFVNVTPVLWAGPVERWIAALNKILEMEVDCIVPGHGPVTDKAGVRPLRDYWVFVANEARRRYQNGVLPSQAAHEIARSPAFTNSVFATWDSPERLLVNVYTLFRWFEGKTEPLRPFERLKIFAEEADFAYSFAGAAPTCLHRHDLHQIRSQPHQA